MECDNKLQCLKNRACLNTNMTSNHRIRPINFNTYAVAFVVFMLLLIVLLSFGASEFLKPWVGILGVLSLIILGMTYRIMQPPAK